MIPIQDRLRFVAVALALAMAWGNAAAGPDPCPEGESRVGDLGFRELSCDCSVSLLHDRPLWRFRQEPQIGGIVEDGPADGKLEDGDVLVAVDGALITTRSGASRLAAVTPGATVSLTVRRDGRQREVRIVAGSVCSGEALGAGLLPRPLREWRIGRRAASRPVWSWSATPAVPAAPATPAPEAAPPGAPSPAEAPAAPEGPTPVMELTPWGWFGMGFNCDCTIHSDNNVRVWEFNDLPEIYYVDEQSPADKAGLRRGDVLTMIDGLSLLTQEGGRRLGSVRPGQAVRWTFRRGSETRSVVAVAKARPGSEATMSLLKLKEDLKTMREDTHMRDLHRELAQLETRLQEQTRSAERASRLASDVGRQRLRYSGTVGTSEVEVRGLGTVVVSTESPSGEIVITTADATIRVRPAKAPTPKRPQRAHPDDGQTPTPR